MNDEINLFFLIYIYDLKDDTRRVKKVIKKKIKNNYKYS